MEIQMYTKKKEKKMKQIQYYIINERNSNKEEKEIF